jgi:hypothetical protein
MSGMRNRSGTGSVQRSEDPFLAQFLIHARRGHRPRRASLPRGAVVPRHCASLLASVVFRRRLRRAGVRPHALRLHRVDPITTPEAEWIGVHGWSAFFDKISSGEVDVLDLARPPVAPMASPRKGRIGDCTFVSYACVCQCEELRRVNDLRGLPDVLNLPVVLKTVTHTSF